MPPLPVGLVVLQQAVGVAADLQRLRHEPIVELELGLLEAAAMGVLLLLELLTDAD